MPAAFGRWAAQDLGDSQTCGHIRNKIVVRLDGYISDSSDMLFIPRAQNPTFDT